MSCGIYKITSPDGKVYVGQATNIERRFKYQHQKMENLKKHSRLYISVLEHGLENHTLSVLEECKKEELNDRERFWQDFYDVLSENGLNSRLTTTKNKPGKFRRETVILFSKALYKREDNTIGQKAMADALRGKRIAPKTKEIRRNNEKSKLISGICVVNSENGVFYNSIKEAAESLSITLNRMHDMLHNKVHNNTPLRIAEEGTFSLKEPKPKNVKVFSQKHIEKLKEAQAKRYANQTEKYNEKIVFDTAMGIFYKNCREAAEVLKVSPGHLSTILNGKKRNNTSLIFA